MAIAAGAEAQGNGSIPRAEALFREGRDAMRRHEYVEACQKFRDSEALDPSPGTSLNWALCDQHLGHFADALLHARWALDRLSPDDNRRPIAERITTDLERRVAYLTVVRSHTLDESAKVYLDGEPLPLEHGAVEARAVDPGEHVIFVEQPSHQGGREIVTLREGETQVREVSAGPKWEPSAQPTVRTSPPLHPWTLRRTLGYTLVGGAAAAFATTVVMTALAFDASATVKAECPDELCTPRGFAAAERGRTFVQVGSVTLAGAVAGAVCAGVLLWPRRSAALAVPLPGGAGVSLVSRF